MGDGSATDARLPMPAHSGGPLHALSLRVHELSQQGRGVEALAAADVYARAAQGFGDELTVTYLVQGRLYALRDLGSVDEAIVAGDELLRRHRATANALGEAKAHALLAQLYMLAGRVGEAMAALARAGRLLDHSSQRNDRYGSALGSYSDAAHTAELYEVADSAEQSLAELARAGGVRSTGQAANGDLLYAEMLLSWGLRLDQIGHHVEAGTRLRRCVALLDGWIEFHGTEAPDPLYYLADLALALAKLGDTDQAVTLAEKVIMPLRAQLDHRYARVAHLGYAVALRAQGDFAGARRELFAAQELCQFGASPAERAIVQYELAVLAVHATAPCDHAEAGRDLLDTIRDQARQLWALRLQRLAMLRQAQQRDELEADRTRARAGLLRDPLTGLANRRRFDELQAAIDAGQLSAPLTLLMADLDKFKLINDTCSHSAGDRVLREVAAVLRAHCRAEDEAVRFAGDEFLVFLRADLATAVRVAERISAAVAVADIPPITPAMSVGVSIGVAALMPGMTAAELFQAADENLYVAKRTGGGRVAG